MASAATLSGFSRASTGDSVAAAFPGALAGKVVLITGANSGQ